MQIINIDEEISKLTRLSGEYFSDYAILHSDKWKDIRKKAKEVLNLLNEKYTLPDKNFV